MMAVLYGSFDPQEENPMAKKRKLRIPGLTFSWKRFFGITRLKQRIARKTGIPTTRQGRQRKLERTLFQTIFGKKR